mgnify:CR=1 FL=1
MKQVTIHTDGSCETQTGEGGWAFTLSTHTDSGEFRLIKSGYEANTTNNRMELYAAVAALRELSERCEVRIVTDSQYLKNAFTAGWLANWQRNGWRTANRQPVKNRDLWETLLELEKQHHITWAWTRGHVGHDGNEEVDSLALAARKTRQGVTRREQRN